MVAKGRRRAGVGWGRNNNRKVLEIFSDRCISDFHKKDSPLYCSIRNFLLSYSVEFTIAQVTLWKAASTRSLLLLVIHCCVCNGYPRTVMALLLVNKNSHPICYRWSGDFLSQVAVGFLECGLGLFVLWILGCFLGVFWGVFWVNTEIIWGSWTAKNERANILSQKVEQSWRKQVTPPPPLNTL